jgi:hypothetical protein
MSLVARSTPVRTSEVRMSDVGQPRRIVEDEPLAWPDEEPLTIPEPAAPDPVREPAPTP